VNQPWAQLTTSTCVAKSEACKLGSPFTAEPLAAIADPGCEVRQRFNGRTGVRHYKRMAYNPRRLGALPGELHSKRTGCAGDHPLSNPG